MKVVRKIYGHDNFTLSLSLMLGLCFIQLVLVGFSSIFYFSSLVFFVPLYYNEYLSVGVVTSCKKESPEILIPPPRLYISCKYYRKDQRNSTCRGFVGNFAILQQNVTSNGHQNNRGTCMTRLEYRNYDGQNLINTVRVCQNHIL